jgi:hypothetical protein
MRPPQAHSLPNSLQQHLVPPACKGTQEAGITAPTYMRQVLDETSLAVTSICSHMRTKFKDVPLQPSLTSRIDDFSATARERMQEKHSHATGTAAFLQGQDVGIALLTESLHCLLTEDKQAAVPLFRLLPDEQLSTVVKEVVSAADPPGSHPYQRQYNVLVHAQSKVKTLISAIAYRALQASDERQLAKQRNEMFSASLRPRSRPPSQWPQPTDRAIGPAPRERTTDPAPRGEPAGTEAYPWCLRWGVQHRRDHTTRPRQCGEGRCAGAPCNVQVPAALESAMGKFFRAGGRATNVAPRANQ